jgi:hypothetical protein
MGCLVLRATKLTINSGAFWYSVGLGGGLAFVLLLLCLLWGLSFLYPPLSEAARAQALERLEAHFLVSQTSLLALASEDGLEPAQLSDFKLRPAYLYAFFQADEIGQDGYLEKSFYRASVTYHQADASTYIRYLLKYDGGWSVLEEARCTDSSFALSCGLLSTIF